MLKFPRTAPVPITSPALSVLPARYYVQASSSRFRGYDDQLTDHGVMRAVYLALVFQRNRRADRFGKPAVSVIENHRLIHMFVRFHVLYLGEPGLTLMTGSAKTAAVSSRRTRPSSRRTRPTLLMFTDRCEPIQLTSSSKLEQYPAGLRLGMTWL